MKQDVIIDKAGMRRFTPISDLNDDNFQQLVENTQSYSLPPGAVLESRFQGGWMIYVVDGTMLQVNELGERYDSVEAGTASAEVPLFSGDTHEGSAEAKTQVQYLRIDRLLFDVLMSRQMTAGTEVNEIDFDEFDAEIFTSIYDAFSQRKLKVPSLPEVLMQVNKAIDDPDMGFAEIAQIVQQDPPYTARLIQLANSAAFRGSNSVDTLSLAISRIGVKNVRSLLMGVAVEKMIGNLNPLALELLRSFYQQSAEIAALCFVMARRLGTVPEERALVAGLLHALGKVPIISHAFDVVEPTPDRDSVDRATQRLVEPVTAWMLSEWGLDGELCDVAENASDWYRPCGEQVELVELVIAARLLHETRLSARPVIALAKTPIGQRLVERGLPVADADVFYEEMATDLEVARELV